MSAEDVHVEAMRGLPEALPPGERVLWQGAPSWKALAIDVFHVRAVVLYGALLIVWRIVTVLHDGGTTQEAAIVALWLVLLPLSASAILALLAKSTAATTVYTITDRRVVLRIGIALTLTLNLPFKRVVSAAYKPSALGTGDLALLLPQGDRIGYAVLWPHARPWVMRRPQPSLRCLPDAERVAGILARALAASANGTARAVEPRAVAVPVGRPVLAG